MSDARPDDAAVVRLAVDPDSYLVKDAVGETAFRRYLRRAHAGPVEAGDEWSEFVNAGCGSRTDVTVSVVGVEGGTRVGPETTFRLD